MNSPSHSDAGSNWNPVSHLDPPSHSDPRCTPEAAITITVKLFAAYQDAIGLPELVWTVPVGSTVATVRDRLLSEHPELEQWRKVTRFGLNLAFVPPETPLQDGDEVVPIPPVSGG